MCGVQKIKRKKLGLKRLLGRTGSVYWVGSGVYKGKRPIFLSFFLFFLSLLPLESKTLSSLSSLVHLLRREVGGGGGGDAVAGRLRRRRRRPKCFFFDFFCCFPMYFNLLYSFLNSKFQKKTTHGPRSKV